MPDLTGTPALDVLIGMAFLFFLLATVVSAVNEVIQTMLNARARTLTRGIRTLLGSADAADDFFADWRIKKLAKPPGFVRNFLQWVPGVAERRRPSYIPARAFALTLLMPQAGDDQPGLIEEVQDTVARLGVPAIREQAIEGLTNAQASLNAVQLELERSFDEVMDRASGWYKRYVQWWLLAISLVVVGALNVSAFTVGERLWKDDALRAAVVQQAQKAVGEDEVEEPEQATPKEVAEQIDRIEELQLPIGWGDANTGGNFWGRLAGWLVTAAAISLGAPFWFDVLGKLSRLRGTGNREGTEKDDQRAPEDRDDPSRRRPAVG